MSKPPSEHALALIKAGISGVPVVGGPIASLIGDYIPTATQRSIEQTMEMLKDRLEKLENRIDPGAVNKDEFSELFKTCYYTAVRTHQESKLRAVVALLENLLLKENDPEKLSYTELDHFARCIEVLSVGAIEVLGYVVKVGRQRDRKKFGNQPVSLDFQDVQNCVPRMDPDLLMGLLGELNAYHLVHLIGSPNVRTKNYGNYPLEIPPIGCRFATSVLRVGEGEGS